MNLSVLKRFSALALCFLTLSCYSPDEFVGEVIIDKNGNFIMTYIGDLIWVPLHREIALGKVPEDKMDEKIQNLVNDLGRDKNFIEVTPKGDARFFVKYKRMGRIVGTGQVTFVRRDSALMMVRTTADETTTFKGISMNPTKLKQFEEVDLSARGIFRVITDAPIIETNAQFIRDNDKGAGKIYEWRINGVETPTPMLSLRLDFENFQTPSEKYSK